MNIHIDSKKIYTTDYKLSLDMAEQSLTETPAIYGNKCKELAKLSNILLKDPIAGVQIPSLKGLSHESFKNFLMQKDPSIFVLWNSLSSAFSYYSDPTNFICDPSTALKLETIQTRIQQACKNITEEELIFFDTDLFPWLNDINNRGSYLMVRSSGVEDGKDFVNAGGNISEAYVTPIISELFTACGKVAASYFAFPSLKNQIVAGLNPFDAEPILSVLLQELIGEPIGGSSNPKEIPTSLVLFTHEPNDSENDFHVMKVSATFGHGTGVVSSADVGSDTAHVVQSRVTKDTPLEAYQNRIKETRLAPVRNKTTGVVELKLIENPPCLQKARSLSNDLIVRLNALSKFIEKHFDDKPMDVEIVIKNDIIYIVQARPVVRPQALPTYVSDELLQEHASSFSQKMNVDVLVPGKGSVLEIQDQNQLLVCNNLAEAEEKYRPEKHKLIIVGTKEPANSHPVVNFSSLGVPCLYTDSLSTMNTTIQNISTTTPFVVCPQSGRSWLFKENISSSNFIKDGYYSHPAQIGISFETNYTPSPFAPSVINNLPVEINEAIRTLKEATTTEVAKKSLVTLQTLTAPKSYSYSLDIPFSGEADKTACVFNSKITSTIQEIEKSFDEGAPRLEKLFHIKTLDTLLSAQPKDSLNSFSLLDINSLYATAETVKLYQNRWNFEWMEFIPAKEFAFTAEGKKLWEDFLFSLESCRAPSQKKDFKELMEYLSKYQALPTFINFIALPLLENQKSKQRTWFEFLGITDPKNPLEIVKELTASLSKSDIALLKTFDEKKKKLTFLKNNLSLFSDPLTYEAAKNDLFALLTFFSDRTSCIAPMNNSSKLTKMMSLECFKELVEVTDLSIKTMKASPLYPVDEKISHLSTLLNKNLDVLEVWVKNQQLSDHLFIGKEDRLSSFDFAGKKYLEKMRFDLRSFNVNQNYMLFPSPNFSVGAAMIGSQANFERHRPKTLEDIFTLIHQNQIFILSHMNQSYLPPNLSNSPFTPPFLQTALHTLENIEYIPTYSYKPSLNKASLHGISLEESSLCFHYNVPLQNHSAGFTIEYGQNGTLIFHGKFLGEARDRWPQFARIVNTLNSQKELFLTHPLHQTAQEISFSWTLHNESEINTAKKIFECFLEGSFYEASLSAIVDILALQGKWAADEESQAHYREIFRYV